MTLEFQFTRLLRGATCFIRHLPERDVSIHAPLARRDHLCRRMYYDRMGFNSRASCEARRCTHMLIRDDEGFNSRASCEARRARGRREAASRRFNSRASCEARQDVGRRCSWDKRFNSRASCEARQHVDALLLELVVSIHAPLARRDRDARAWRGQQAVSIHAPLARRDELVPFRRKDLDVSIHAPLARRDLQKPAAFAHGQEFQFTRLLRGATATIYSIIALQLLYRQPKHDVLYHIHHTFTLVFLKYDCQRPILSREPHRVFMYTICSRTHFMCYAIKTSIIGSTVVFVPKCNTFPL